jgi:hypothetical protein
MLTCVHAATVAIPEDLEENLISKGVSCVLNRYLPLISDTSKFSIEACSAKGEDEPSQEYPHTSQHTWRVREEGIHILQRLDSWSLDRNTHWFREKAACASSTKHLVKTSYLSKKYSP